MCHKKVEGFYLCGMVQHIVKFFYEQEGSAEGYFRAFGLAGLV